jgi:hypothetical protein
MFGQQNSIFKKENNITMWNDENNKKKRKK